MQRVSNHEQELQTNTPAGIEKYWLRRIDYQKSHRLRLTEEVFAINADTIRETEVRLDLNDAVAYVLVPKGYMHGINAYDDYSYNQLERAKEFNMHLEEAFYFLQAFPAPAVLIPTTRGGLIVNLERHHFVRAVNLPKIPVAFFTLEQIRAGIQQEGLRRSHLPSIDDITMALIAQVDNTKTTFERHGMNPIKHPSLVTNLSNLKGALQYFPPSAYYAGQRRSN